MGGIAMSGIFFFLSQRKKAVVVAAVISTAFITLAPSHAEPNFTDQGSAWSAADRKDYYVRDQGSRLLPLSWFKALKHTDGTGFLEDSLGRYGYLPNPDTATPGLPIGFLAARENGVDTLAMTCAACHTRQIEVSGVSWRIDGGPAIADFQGFLADLDKAFDKIVHNDDAFADFASRVPDQDRADLHRRVAEWFQPYHAIIEKSLPDPPWGLGRLDAVSMIYNRLVGLDIGASPTRILEDNMEKANAPVRYPFLWNAPIQDFTQWPGFSPNGDDLLALNRNIGEVFGVFAIFHPAETLLPIKKRYLDDCSLNFEGLLRLETLIKKIEPPKWPWALDRTLLGHGKELYDRQCASCHEIDLRGERRACNAKPTWKTLVQDVGTDDAEFKILFREASTGVLEGAWLPLPNVNLRPLGSREKIIDLLNLSIAGSILDGLVDPRLLIQHTFQPLLEECLPNDSTAEASKNVLAQSLQNLLVGEGLLKPKPEGAPKPSYESRVLKGIWATAPYLHNGSVPTLAELLKPPAQRVVDFKVGPAYDIENVGLSKDQTKFDYTFRGKAECTQETRSSGNSHCGHDFGTQLNDADKKALLEYLKSL